MGSYQGPTTLKSHSNVMVDMLTHTPLASPGDNSVFVQLKSLLRPENRPLIVVLVKHLLSKPFSHIAFLEQLGSVCC